MTSRSLVARRNMITIPGLEQSSYGSYLEAGGCQHYPDAYSGLSRIIALLCTCGLMAARLASIQNPFMKSSKCVQMFCEMTGVIRSTMGKETRAYSTGRVEPTWLRIAVSS